MSAQPSSFGGSLIAATLSNQWGPLIGKPNVIRFDNTGEMRSAAFQTWAQKQDIRLMFIQPGKPT